MAIRDQTSAFGNSLLYEKPVPYYSSAREAQAPRVIGSARTVVNYGPFHPQDSIICSLGSAGRGCLQVAVDSILNNIVIYFMTLQSLCFTSPVVMPRLATVGILPALNLREHPMVICLHLYSLRTWLFVMNSDLPPILQCSCTRVRRYANNLGVYFVSTNPTAHDTYRPPKRNVQE